LQVIKTGETSIKGYLLMSVIETQIKALMHRLREDEIVIQLIKTIEEVEEKCMPILTAIASEFDVPRSEPSNAPQLMDLVKDN
ncbi:hypothetical protein GQ44DRAFT_634536, partial [Phaeosphaeriaceae sp. PMI808]